MRVGFQKTISYIEEVLQWNFWFLGTFDMTDALLSRP